MVSVRLALMEKFQTFFVILISFLTVIFKILVFEFLTKKKKEFLGSVRPKDKLKPT